MKIQFNTDKTISGEDRNQNHFSGVLQEGLKRFESHITRIEVHMSDENGKKDGINDTVCLLEARLEGKKPIAVSSKGDSEIVALTGAINKLKASLTTILGRDQDKEKENIKM